MKQLDNSLEISNNNVEISNTNTSKVQAENDFKLNEIKLKMKKEELAFEHEKETLETKSKVNITSYWLGILDNIVKLFRLVCSFF